VKIGQKVKVKTPDNLVTTGRRIKREEKLGHTTGTIAGIYPHHILIDFGKYKSCYRKVDIKLGIEYFKEVSE
jgi:hypothetical protein